MSENENRSNKNTNTNKKHNNNNNSKRTHVPVNGHKIEELRAMSLENLITIANELSVENPHQLKRQDLIFAILSAEVTKGGFILFTGILEIMHDGYGFLRAMDINLTITSSDVYVSNTQVRKFALRTGDVVTGQVRAPKDQEKYNALLKVEAINYLPLKESRNRPLFENLTPLYPTEQLNLEYEPLKLTGRVVDMFMPMGKGQRGLIVAPPRSGKTELMKEFAHGLSKNHPEVELIVLLVDERPEEVTDMQRSVKGDVYSSTFDLPATNHVRVAELVVEKAKRLVEMGRDVVILLDSLTRLARAFNTVVPSSGKVLSGGVDANALHRPKRFFGAARNIEEGGSLTIIATALIETGSRMDEVIFEEFKGTGNAEVILSRQIADRRIYPAVDITKSGTRKEELLIDKNTLPKIWAIRNAINQMEDVEALKFLYSRMLKTKDNTELLANMNNDD